MIKISWAYGLTRKTSIPCQNLMSLHVVHCQDIGSEYSKYDFAFDIRHRVRTRTSRTFPYVNKSFDTSSEVGSKSLRPKKGMLSPHRSPPIILNICYITLCIVITGRDLDKQACSSTITVIYSFLYISCKI